MGLDMYLNVKVYTGFYDDEKRAANQKPLKELVMNIMPKLGSLPLQYLEFEGIYWRKANAVHKWFVDNVQDGNDDCRSYSVSVEMLEKLHKEVCAVLKNKKLAEKKLPSQQGFFFGNTEYDKQYFEDLKYTKDKIEALLKIVKGLKNDVDLQYHSSW